MRTALVLLLLAASAEAHFVPGERLVIVQAEPRSVAILVSYRPPSGIVSDFLGADSAWARPGRKAEFVRALLALRALAPLTILLDGAPLPLGDMEIKLAEDPPGTGRAAVAVLVTAALPPGAHRLVVDVAAAREPTSTQWLDRAAGRIASFGPRPAGVPFQDKGELVLAWGTASRVAEADPGAAPGGPTQLSNAKAGAGPVPRPASANR